MAPTNDWNAMSVPLHPGRRQASRMHATTTITPASRTGRMEEGLTLTRPRRRITSLVLACLMMTTATPIVGSAAAGAAPPAGCIPDHAAQELKTQVTNEPALCAFMGGVDPSVSVAADIGLLGGGPVCTGTKTVVSIGTVGGAMGGILAEVYAEVETALLTQYDFACKFDLLMTASGAGGFARTVYATASVDGVNGPPCEYNGITSWRCTTPTFSAFSGSFGGSGIAGPANGQTPAWPLPTEIRVCPGLGFEYAEGINEGIQGLLDVRDIDYWECKTFGIHYTSALTIDVPDTDEV